MAGTREGISCACTLICTSKTALVAPVTIGHIKWGARSRPPARARDEVGTQQGSLLPSCCSLDGGRGALPSCLCTSGRTSPSWQSFLSVHVTLCYTGRRNLFGSVEGFSRNFLTYILTFRNEHSHFDSISTKRFIFGILFAS